MLGLLFGFGWKKSPAHLFLLSKFLKPKSPDHFSNYKELEYTLKETPKKAIKRFLKKKMVESVSLPELISRKFKVSELKKMLKKCGLEASGNKDKLINRLIEFNKEEMIRVTQDLVLFHCSDKGRIVAENYLAKEKIYRIEVENNVKHALKNRDFLKASSLVAGFESKQLFPRGFNVDWKEHDIGYDVKMLKLIFNKTPKILMSIEKEQAEALRLASSMMYLWGAGGARRWLSDSLNTNLIINNDCVARMFLSHARYLMEIGKCHGSSVKKVEIIGATDSMSCEACKKINGKKFKLNEVPELPYEKCTSKQGCRCIVIA